MSRIQLHFQGLDQPLGGRAERTLGQSSTQFRRESHQPQLTMRLVCQACQGGKSRTDFLGGCLLGQAPPDDPRAGMGRQRTAQTGSEGQQFDDPGRWGRNFKERRAGM
jgi:hypothetical protein